VAEPAPSGVARKDRRGVARTQRRLTAQAVGNPLYVRELVDALLREQAVTAGPVAEAGPRPDQLPTCPWWPAGRCQPSQRTCRRR